MYYIIHTWPNTSGMIYRGLVRNNGPSNQIDDSSDVNLRGSLFLSFVIFYCSVFLNCCLVSLYNKITLYTIVTFPSING